MKKFLFIVVALLLSAKSGFCSRDVAFIGLTGNGAPAIEKNFTRHFQEQLSMMPDVRSMNSIEVDHLREWTSGTLLSATVTPTLYNSLKRFVSDSTLVIWGRVKECTVKPERFWVVGAGIRGILTLELSIYDLANKQFIYIGNASSSILQKKWFVLWGPLDRAVQISAQDRTQLIDQLELKSVSAASGILSTIILHETAKRTKQAKWSTEVEKKTIEPPTHSLDKRNPADSANEEPTFIEEEPSDIQKLPPQPKTKKPSDSGEVPEQKTP